MYGANKFVLPGEGLFTSGGDLLRIQLSAILFPARSFSVELNPNFLLNLWFRNLF